MGGCAVPGCASRTEFGIKLYGIPALRFDGPLHTRQKCERRRLRWLTSINRIDLMYQITAIRICSLHFICGKPALSDESNPDWVPSISLGNSNEDGDYPFNDPPHDPVPFEPYHVGPENDHLEGILGDKSIQEGAGRHQMDQNIGVTQGKFDTKSSDDTCDNSQSDSSVMNISSVRSCVDETAAISFLDNSTLTDSDMIEISTDANGEAQQESMLNVTSTSWQDAEFDKLQTEHCELQGSLSKLWDHLIDTESDRAQHQKSSVDLRNKLTECEVDKLELAKDLSDLQETCDLYKVKCTSLEEESASLKEKVTMYEGKIKQLEQELEQSNQKLLDLEEKLKKTNVNSLSLEELKNNDELVKFYTGLSSYTLFEIILNHISDHVTDSIRALEPYQCLLLTLMRLRLALTLEDLSYRFGVSLATVIRTFEKWLYYMYVYLDPLIVWPDRETLYATMPNNFKDAFGKSVAVIIDCFELFIDRPRSLDTRAMTWSNYKHHNTVKFLIGITPLGVISFISEAWGGRVSDKHIAANSGLYEKLLPHDVIMADRGFTIAEDVGFYCAKLLIPAFTKGQAQLSSHDIGDTRKIASLRVHVERVIGLLKRKYRLLKSGLPQDYMCVKPGHKVSQIDEMVRVCCALTNLSNSIM